MHQEKLKNYRLKIDEIDNQLVNLLQQRFSYTNQIMQLKKQHTLPPTDANREQEIITRLNQNSPTVLHPLIEKMYQLIFQFSKVPLT